jgi:hypothetical protein
MHGAQGDSKLALSQVVIAVWEQESRGLDQAEAKVEAMLAGVMADEFKSIVKH